MTKNSSVASDVVIHRMRVNSLRCRSFVKISTYFDMPFYHTIIHTILGLNTPRYYSWYKCNNLVIRLWWKYYINVSERIYIQISKIRLCDKLTLIAKRDVKDTKLLQPSSLSPSAAAEKGNKIFLVYSSSCLLACPSFPPIGIYLFISIWTWEGVHHSLLVNTVYTCPYNVGPVAQSV